MAQLKFVVYCHTNMFNNHQYIGITSADPPEKRWGSNGINYKPCVRFYNAIQKYGWENFKHEILEENLTKEQAKEAEKFYIKEFNTLSPNGYNLTTGGDLPQFSQETLKKMSESHKGKKLSKQTRKNMSKAKIGHKGYNKKPVWMCDKETHHKLFWFESATDGAKFLEQMGKGDYKQLVAHINSVCRGKRKSAYGYYWERGDALSPN